MSGLVLLKPIFSEKAQNVASQGSYTFKVLRTSNKNQIKKAVEVQFGVKVAKVNIMNFKSEIKRIGRHFGKTKPFKKAIVKLREGSIDLWVPPEKSKTKKEEKVKEEKKEVK